MAAAAAVAAALLGVTGAVWATSGDPSTGGTLRGRRQPRRCGARGDRRVRRALPRSPTDTGKAFNAQLTVVNAGKAAVDGWALSFDFPGDQKVKAVAGRVAQAGTAVTVRGAAALAPGKSAAVRLSGGYGRSNAFPLDFSLDGTGCRPFVSGVAGTPAVKKPAPAVEKPAPAAKPKPKPKAKDDDNSGPGGGGSGKGGKGKGGEDD